MSHPESSASRRRRLLVAAQGRPLEEAYQQHGVRADLEAEVGDAAAVARQETLLTPDMLEHLRELIAAKQEAEVVATSPGGSGFELFCSTDAAVIVPGFLASSLGDVGSRGLGLIWVSPALVLSNELGALQLGPYDGSESDLDPRVQIVPTGPLPILYDLLRLALEVRRYATEIFAVDWRKDIDLSARRLAARLRALGNGPRPVHLIAHSQGGLVARRALQLMGPEEARRVVKNLVLLGPANYGTFSAVLALGGGHSMLPLARRLGIEPPQGFQQVLASMTGLYQLLPWDAARVPWLAANDLGRPGSGRAGSTTPASTASSAGAGSSTPPSSTTGPRSSWATTPGPRPSAAYLRRLDDARAARGRPARRRHRAPLLLGPARGPGLPGPRHRALDAGDLSQRHRRRHRHPGRPAARPAGVLSRRAGSSPRRTPRGPAPGRRAPRPRGRGRARARDRPRPAGRRRAARGRRARRPQRGLPLQLRREEGRARGAPGGVPLRPAPPGGAVPQGSLPHPGRVLELQVNQTGRDARTPSMELILDASNLLPFDFLRTGDRLGPRRGQDPPGRRRRRHRLPGRPRHPADQPPRPARLRHRRRRHRRGQL